MKKTFYNAVQKTSNSVWKSFFIILLLVAFQACNKPPIDNASFEQSLSNDDVSEIKEKLNKINKDTLQFEGGTSLLHYAIYHQATKITNYLIDNELFINNVDLEGQTALHYAAMNDDAGLTARLLETNIAIDLLDSINGAGALHYAVARHNYDISKQIISKGGNVNLQISGKYDTALHMAIRNRYVDITALLLNNKAIDTIKDINENTAIEMATQSLDFDIVTLFINKFSEEQKNTLLKNFVRNDIHIDYLSKLLNENKFTKNALQEAFIFVKTPEVAGVLLEKGINVNYLSKKHGYAAIHHAAIRGDYAMIQYLLKNGAKVNLRSKNKTTPLLYAASISEQVNDLEATIGSFEISLTDDFMDSFEISNDKTKENSLESVKVLLENGAKTTLKNSKNQTALQIADECKNEEVSKYIKNK